MFISFIVKWRGGGENSVLRLEVSYKKNRGEVKLYDSFNLAYLKIAALCC